MLTALTSLVGLAAVAALASAQPAPLPTHYLYSIGGPDLPGRFNAARRLAVDGAGRAYLTDGLGVQVLEADRQAARMWGGPGHGDGQLSGAGGLAVSLAGQVLVADTGNGRVLRFDADGTYLGALVDYPDAARPGGRRRFLPVDLALAADGTLFVGDGLDSRVVVFGAGGHFLRAWGEAGTGEGQIAGLTALAVDPEGRVWVGDGGVPGRVSVFAPDGRFLRRFETGPVADLDLGFNVWVATAAGRLRVFGLDGSPVAPPGLPGDGEMFREVLSVASSDRAEAWVLARRTDGGRAAELLRIDLLGQPKPGPGTPPWWWVSRPPAPGALDPASIELDLAGDLYVADPADGLGQVQVLALDGGHRATWTDGGAAEDGIRDPAGIAVEPLGPVYVADRERGAVLVLDPADGRLAGALGGPAGGEAGLFAEAGPGDVAAPHEASSLPRRVYATDPGNGRVVAFDAAGRVTRFGAQGEGQALFVGAPGHLATSPQGWVYATDGSARQTVRVFDYAGLFRFAFDGQLGEDSRLAPLAGIDYAPGSGPFLSDPRRRIQAAGSRGEPLGGWDLGAARPDLAIQPGEIVANSDGRLFVADRAHRRIHVFGREPAAAWRLEQFANAWLAAAPQAVTSAAEPVFDWGDAGPGPGLPADGFSVRLARFLTLEPGWYRLTVAADGLVRLRVDERLLIDDWREGAAPREALARIEPGAHYLQLEYADSAGPARLSLAILPAQGPALPSTTPPAAAGTATATSPPPTPPLPSPPATGYPAPGGSLWLPFAGRAGRFPPP